MIIESFLRHKIQFSGPVSVSDFMRAILSFPKEGYYTRKEKDIIGAKGDFTTSPEISQLFGEVIACWFLSKVHEKQTYNIIELGPGRATLLRDVIRTIETLKKIDIGSITLLESSEHFKNIQKQTLTPLGYDIKWIHDLSECQEIHDSNKIIICHEFFDSLPIHVFERDSRDTFGEILVDFVRNNFTFVKSARPTINCRLLKIDEMFPCSRYMPNSVEVSPLSWKFARDLAKIGRDTCHTIGIIADYGLYGPSTSSLRAIKDHGILSSPFKYIGKADLSANVDFMALDFYLRSTYKTFFQTQREFLLSNHIAARASVLLKNYSNQAENAIGLHRLTDENRMGNVYKFLCFEKK